MLWLLFIGSTNPANYRFVGSSPIILSTFVASTFRGLQIYSVSWGGVVITDESVAGRHKARCTGFSFDGVLRILGNELRRNLVRVGDDVRLHDCFVAVAASGETGGSGNSQGYLAWTGGL